MCRSARRLVLKMVLPLICMSSLIMVACSIKEDRRFCPAVLLESIAGSIENHNSLDIFIWGEDSFYKSDNITAYSVPSGGHWSVKVPKGICTVAAVAGIQNSRRNGSAFEIPQGSQADPLWIYNAKVDCSKEIAYDTLSLRKSFCKLTVLVEGYSSSLESYPYAFQVEGRSVGIDIYENRLIDGLFISDVREEGKNRYTVRLPRQNNGDCLTLRLLKNGKADSELDLSSIMRDMGYDWQKDDLEDVFIGVDIVDQGLVFDVQSWQCGEEIDNVVI